MLCFKRQAYRNIVRQLEIGQAKPGSLVKRETKRNIYDVKRSAFLNTDIRFKQCRQISSTSVLHQHQHVREFTPPDNTTEDFKHMTDLPSVRGYDVAEDGKTVDVKWSDGSSSRYHSIWLRFNCKCLQCTSTGNTCNSWLFPIHEVPLDMTIKDMKIEDNGRISITWNEEDHQGLLTTNYLKKECYSDESLRRRRDEARMKFQTDTSIPNISWTEVQKDEKAFYRWLRYLHEPGICLLKDVPTEQHYVKRVLKMIGNLEDTLFGEIWDVKSEEKPNMYDISYSPSPLAYHMDLCIYEGQPGLQFLHCLRFDDTITGGETIFTDIFHVAELFRQKHPDAFRTLSTVPNTFRRINYIADDKVHMVHRRPIIQVNDENQVIRVSWHGHEQGPPLVNQENVEEFYRALQLFARELIDYPYMRSLKLKPTDMICFNNRRFSHARTSFDNSASGVRMLQGSYINLEDFKSKLIVLANKYGDTDPIGGLGNGDWT